MWNSNCTPTETEENASVIESLSNFLSKTDGSSEKLTTTVNDFISVRHGVDEAHESNESTNSASDDKSAESKIITYPQRKTTIEVDGATSCLHPRSKVAEIEISQKATETGVLTIEEGEEEVEEGDIKDLELSETGATSNTQNQPENVIVTKESCAKEGNTRNVGLHVPAKLRKTSKPEAPKNVKGTSKTTTKSDETDVQINKAYQLLTQVAEKRSSMCKDACALFADHIDEKLRKFDPLSRARAEQQITTIMSDTKMRILYSQQGSASTTNKLMPYYQSVPLPTSSSASSSSEMHTPMPSPVTSPT
ncbi:hypothetical protein FQA39_LY02570 [Lamprigera yunnana]|nr:hypothetical protein FQA39_LY02570 [Lamprigera yunnana]